MASKSSNAKAEKSSNANIKQIMGVIGDCADDLLGGGNAVSLTDAAIAYDLISDIEFTLKLYIRQCCSDCKIAAHGADPELLEHVREFAYGNLTSTKS